MLGRRKFLKFLGLGAASTAVAKNITIIENKEDLRNDPASIPENISKSRQSASCSGHSLGQVVYLSQRTGILPTPPAVPHQTYHHILIPMGIHYSQDHINIGDIIYEDEKGDIINNKTDKPIGVAISSQDEDGWFATRYNS